MSSITRVFRDGSAVGRNIFSFSIKACIPEAKSSRKSSSA